MTTRSDIEKGKLVYTEKLGWVDLGHATGDDARVLMSTINAGDNTKESYFTVRYIQYMGKGNNYGTTKIIKWRVRRGLSLHDKKSVAITIMMYTTHLFESNQGSFPFNWIMDSGYSSDDLTSNLLGFYRAINGVDYLFQLGVVSKEDALKRWDYYGPIGKYKNKVFKPLLFQDPEKYPNNARPYNGTLPSFLNTISPIIDMKISSILINVKDVTEINIGVEHAQIGLE
ncbi:hypothetical protein [Xenorhabdus bovienii]|uniref:hypothetical protein n=1 Tax=Xenorhabdus bovienii TaxID=40576 RepID=UPI0023B3150B|nr:hypothetical protein [Xenorhabdus bovienii]MDE9428577.1 hypothetical protein [Xenorhabdus bovienii]